MGTITNETPVPLKAFGDRGVHMIQWLTMGDADTGTSIEMPGSSDRSVQIAGTFDSATVVLQGSNDGTNWATLTDPQGNAISKTGAAIEMITELTRYIRPVTSGGQGSTDIDVTVLVKRVN